MNQEWNRGKKIWLSAIVLFLSVAVLYFWFSNRHFEVINAPPNGREGIVAVGDSLVVGVGASEGKDFITLLSMTLNEPTLNFGRSGDTTGDVLQRIETVLSKKPSVVIVLVGGNDYLKRIPKSQTFENLGKITRKIQNSGAAVLILGVRGGLLSDSYEKDFEDFARAYGTAYVPNVLDGIIGKSQYLSPDKIHPNDLGYEKIARKVLPELRRILNK
ncbi:MAG: GDSL-type esterase/lipase family protein [bacterium]|nr:GDSL-type esterase/lipase family protein [bacterium]